MEEVQAKCSGSGGGQRGWSVEGRTDWPLGLLGLMGLREVLPWGQTAMGISLYTCSLRCDMVPGPRAGEHRIWPRAQRAPDKLC